MKAPEKIFISPLLMQGCRTLSTRVTENDVVYIRKDLLIEWMEQYEKRARTAIIPLLVKDFLEKLNSL